ncbi:DUF3014 domain-containing protein [Paucibacter sp. M5-1]|uniref:DUF3014 domain-containing protein n=1 Tax=Paucibacter sp. M5-1 TaxID=3015998 RepID=UPI003F7D047B
MLNTRNLVLACAAMGLLALGLVGWQLTQRPLATPGSSSDSGLVTPAPARPAVDPPATSATPALPPVPPASATMAAETNAPAPKTPNTPTAAKAAPPAPPRTAATASPAIKHRVAAQATRPPILPNEVDSVVAKTLGPKALARYFYMEPLARRFVASVDKLGEKQPPTSQWLLRPARGELRLSPARKAQDGRVIAAANSQRYADFLRWFERTDNARLLSLYARMYPLLQQTYVELGHPEGYFNDRLIAVIDQMLATPLQKSALRVKPASPETLAAAARTPTTPRYEIADPALEALSTGQKMMLRIGPAQAARLKIKLKSLRAGLLRLGR